MDKVWLQSYPPGIASQIEPTRGSLVEMFEHVCQTYAERPAISNMGSSLTYEQLERKSKHFAAYLQHELGLVKGDRFAIMLPNTLQYYVALFGALRAGLIIVNVNPLYTYHELTYQLNDAGATTIIVLENFAHTVEKSLPDTKLKNIIVTSLGDLFSPLKSVIINFGVKYLKKLVPKYSLPTAISFTDSMKEGKSLTFNSIHLTGEDIAFLQYTGGTTGTAKGAILSHRNMLSNLAQCITWLHVDKKETQEVLIAPLPLYHILSLTLCCLVMMEIGGLVVLITNPRDLNDMIKTLQKTKYTWFAGINTLYNALVHNEKFLKLDFSNLTLCLAGGAATSSIVAKKWRDATGVSITEGYGLTEASPVVTLNPLTLSVFNGSIGLPLPSTELDICDDSGKSLPLGEIGEIYIKGPQVMRGYWNQPEETKNVFTADGWLKTGDMAYVTKDGYVFLVDRKKEMIKVSGFNVYPSEVKQVLMNHPGIKEAAVVGVPSDETGEQVKAVIVKDDPNLTAENVAAYCREYLTMYKRPKLIQFVEELPKSAVGKVLDRVLRAQHIESLK